VDASGAVQYVIATGIDISERKRVEEALNEAHRFNQAILETAVDGIICIDGKGYIAVFNPAAEKIFGYPAAEVLGSNINLLMPDPFRSEHDHYLRRYAETGVKNITGSSAREVVGRRKDGSLFPLDLAVGEIPLPGKQTMFAGMVRDITERKLAEQEAKRRLDELAQVSRLSLMGEMASGLAHEINQPLAAIVNYAHACRRLVQAGRAEPSVLLDTLEQIARQGQRAGEIVSHLRQFIHRGKTERALADINAIVSNVIELLGHEIEAQRVALQLDLDGSLPPYAMDKIQIEQVILNLVKNAIDAMRAMAQDARRLRIQTRRHDGLAEAVEVIVSDTGEGLPAGEINRVFDPLFTTKPNGIGVGLSISRSIVHTHGGRLWAVPNPSTGACFHFTLPVVRGGLS
jgi:two-component system, LuxR family, sensor kinase FixL